MLKTVSVIDIKVAVTISYHKVGVMCFENKVFFSSENNLRVL